MKKFCFTISTISDWSNKIILTLTAILQYDSPCLIKAYMAIYQSRFGLTIGILYILVAICITVFGLRDLGSSSFIGDAPGLLFSFITLPSHLTLGLVLYKLGIPIIDVLNTSIIIFFTVCILKA